MCMISISLFFEEKKHVDLCAMLLKKYRPTATFDENHYSN